VRPLDVFQTRIAGKDVRAPKIGRVRNISYERKLELRQFYLKKTRYRSQALPRT
jgi:hypothetical protein